MKSSFAVVLAKLLNPLWHAYQFVDDEGTVGNLIPILSNGLLALDRELIHKQVFF
jgi:hypothetical protein